MTVIGVEKEKETTGEKCGMKKKRKTVSTWEPNTIIATCVIEVREEGEVQRLEKMRGDMLNRLGVKAML